MSKIVKTLLELKDKIILDSFNEAKKLTLLVLHEVITDLLLQTLDHTGLKPLKK